MVALLCATAKNINKSCILKVKNKTGICYCWKQNNYNFLFYFCNVSFILCGPDSSVGIATGYGLDGPGIESRWDEIFPTCSERPWGPHILMYNRQRVFPGGRKQPGRDADPKPLSSAEV
jgi:hypothetical protein